MTETQTRLASGITALLVILPILVWGGFWGISALVYFASVWAMHEMATMALPEQRNRAFAMLLVFGTPIFALAALSTSTTVPGTDIAVPDRGLLLLAAVALAFQGSALFFLFTAKSTDGLADRWGRFLLALIYVPLLLGLLPSIVVLDGGRGWIWVALAVGWFGDIGGYFAGRAFGKNKMLPLISPKKTWEGFVGGVALAIVGLVIWKFGIFDWTSRGEVSMTLLDCFVIGIFGDVAGVTGDFVESMLKRTWGVKDSGRFLPGHGGMLDRIDAVMFAAPVVWAWLVVVRPLVIA
jgi:phosphatidate cytidylyltransferase